MRTACAPVDPGGEPGRFRERALRLAEVLCELAGKTGGAGVTTLAVVLRACNFAMKANSSQSSKNYLYLGPDDRTLVLTAGAGDGASHWSGTDEASTWEWVHAEGERSFNAAGDLEARRVRVEAGASNMLQARVSIPLSPT